MTAATFISVMETDDVRNWLTPNTAETMAVKLFCFIILLQGISIRPFPGCENAAGKLTQKG